MADEIGTVPEEQALFQLSNGRYIMGECELCGRWGPVERHHAFGGPKRQLSERYGLTVKLCHSCHNEPPNGVHFNPGTRRIIQQEAQRRAMREQTWSTEDFVRVFGKNYLED